VLSPFVLERPDRARLSAAALRLIAAVVLAASAAAGLTALWRDLRFAHAWAGPSIYSAVDRRQMAAVQAAVPEGAVILLVARPTDVWHARLWQRGLYPRNPVAVLLEPVGPAAVGRLRARYGIRYAVLIGPPGVDPGLAWRRDLGALAGLPERVSFGALAP
jgi:hypothetical protein